MKRKDKKKMNKDVKENDGSISWDDYYSIGSAGLESVASDYIRDMFFTEEIEPPSYENKIPIGEDWQSGETVWMDINSGDRIGIFGRTGSGKCLSPSSTVLTNKGRFKAEKIYEKFAKSKEGEDSEGEWFKLPEDFKIASLENDGNIEWRKPSVIYRENFQGKMFHVKLQDGSEITITGSHPLLTEDGWVDGENLEEGTQVGVPKQVPKVETEHVKPEIAKLLAWQIAEGCEWKWGRSDNHRITQADGTVLEELKEILQSLDIKRRKHRDKQENNSIRIREKDDGVKCLEITSQEYREILEEYGVRWGEKSAEKEIPESIMNAQEEAKKKFLREFFDAEGHVENKTVIEFNSASKELMEQLKTLLKEFGVSMRIRETSNGRNDTTYYGGRIGGDDLRKYSKVVGFERKEPNIETENVKHHTIPVNDLLTPILDKGIPITEPLNYTGSKPRKNQSRESLTQIIEKIDEWLNTDRDELNSYTRSKLEGTSDKELENWKNKLEERVSQEIKWVRITEIEEIDNDGYIYDLSVPETHNFVAENIIAHNTFLLKAIISRLFLGGSKILHLSDVKNDFIDLDHGDGIQKHHMNIMENEKRQPIPVHMYMPKFMEDDYVPKPPQKKNFHAFAYRLDELSESDFMQLVGADTDAKKDLAITLYDMIDNEGKGSFSELYDELENMEDDFGKRTIRSIKSSLENLERQKVISGRYSKRPTDNLDEAVVSIALEHWDKYKRKAMEKVELQIAITTRKILDKLREGEMEGPVTMIIDEAHTFAPADGSSVSRDDIIDIIDLGRAYDIPMIFATQRVSQIPKEDVIDQMNKFFISKTLSDEDRKTLLKAANIYEHGDAQRNRWTRIFRQMGKYDKMMIDKQKGEWTVIKNFSPLCSHK